MRKFLITLLLAGAAASPALAQDYGRHHHDDNNSNSSREERSQSHNDRGERGNRDDGGQAQQQARDAARSIANGGHASRSDVQAAVRDYQQRHQGDASQLAAQQQAVQQQAFQQRQRAYDRNRRDNWTGGANNPAQRIVEQQIRQDARSGDRNGYYGQRSRQYSSDHGRWTNGGWDRSWRNNSRYDWRRYRNNHRSIFHLGYYYDPFGYNYRSFDIGYFLQPAYYSQNFWFDSSMYGLPYPPPGTQWVRYWNDAVLVDVYSGEVVDVIRGFFW